MDDKLDLYFLYQNTNKYEIILTFKNPLGVMTLGCTCELHAPSHLFTAMSPLHVL